MPMRLRASFQIRLIFLARIALKLKYLSLNMQKHNIRNL